ncbi:MAG: tRNA 2-thiocytidine(32) synthetase TtcA [Candidatus Omnitrophica bacterium]|nr:tRNA 2-thiocytidine(32) synthetase TtcA [Candidatus Omnitrophota bacterium]
MLEIKEKRKKPKGLFLNLIKKVGKAIYDYNMIENNDRICVAVSGGKDSLSLLKLLDERKRFVPIKYELLALHIDMGYSCIQPKILEEYFKKNNYNYHIERIDILRETKIEDLSCFWCSWNRRKAIFKTAEKFGCNKVALGHHFDDIIQTILLNLFFHGEISSMSPKQELFEGKLTIIRPLCYIEERLLEAFSKRCNFPSPKCICPNSLDSKRTLIENIIRELAKVDPKIKKNIFMSVKRIKKDYLL